MYCNLGFVDEKSACSLLNTPYTLDAVGLSSVTEDVVVVEAVIIQVYYFILYLNLLIWINITYVDALFK